MSRDRGPSWENLGNFFCGADILNSFHYRALKIGEQKLVKHE